MKLCCQGLISVVQEFEGICRFELVLMIEHEIVHLVCEGEDRTSLQLEMLLDEVFNDLKRYWFIF